MSNVRSDVLQGLAEILERAHLSGLCANCSAMLVGETPHVCKPEEQANLMLTSVWRHHLGGSSPMKRAISYGVK